MKRTPDEFRFTMTSGDVARVLDITDERVRQLDDELQPKRRANGRRYYDPKVVEAVAKRREAALRDRAYAPIAPLQTRGGRPH